MARKHTPFIAVPRPCASPSTVRGGCPAAAPVSGRTVEPEGKHARPAHRHPATWYGGSHQIGR
ncbi:hypothetical protein OBBRIDRAFT_794654 [Obba rivulosa]|uniref:Uncharacterized protein n=1 Tax=Obba rivulosa TaxID=1052685 RepID=A0A8E2DJI2_9APHY|nr:hypothetical protein OBBRIDRAFT_794654 [Obba rivulosa]